MLEERCSLTWDNYSDHLREMLHEMIKTKELTDVTLVCDDKNHIKAHKVVLSACSSVLRNILPESDSVVYITGIHYQQLVSILEFMYFGVASLQQDSIEEFVEIAKVLDIQGIDNNTIGDKNYENDEFEEIPKNYDDFQEIEGEKQTPVVQNPEITLTNKPQELIENEDFQNRVQDRNVQINGLDGITRIVDKILDEGMCISKTKSSNLNNSSNKRSIHQKQIM